jgi:predicted Zn-dependent protease
MARFLAKPELIRQIDKSEELRRDALYLVDFFKNEEIFKRYHELKTLWPEDASVRYGEYKALRELRQPDNALAALAQAVVLDPVYAYEYQELADLALGKELKDKAIELLEKAVAAVPNDPFLRLQKARMLLAIGRDDEGKVLMQELSRLPWSPVYYPEVRAEIERLY